MFESVRDLLVRGIAAAKAGEKDEARFFLEWALRNEPPMPERIEAWLWMSQMSDTPEEKRRFLEEVLVREPANPRARRMLAILDGKLDPEEIVDPDRLGPQAIGSQESATAQRFTCPTCGGRMVFAPDGQALTCEYCESRRTSVGTVAAEQDFTVAMATARGHRVPVAMRAFDCQGCGTAFILGPQAISVTCPYCGSAYVVQETNTRELVPPDGLIPLRLGRVEAQQAVEAWCRQHNQKGRPEPVQGIYLPVWVFDLSGQIPWSGLAYNSGRRMWTPVSGEEPILVDNVAVPASERVAGPLDEALEETDFAALLPYDPSYLSDWPAETYQRAMSDAALVARQRVYAQARQRVEHNVLHRLKDVKTTSTGIAIDSFQLVLVPLWISAVAADGKQHRLVVSGASGRVYADRPLAEASGLLGWLLREG